MIFRGVDKGFLFVLVAILMLRTLPVIQAQNAPVTTAWSVPNALPGVVQVPLTVTGFTNVGAISLSLDYNYSAMHFIQGVPNGQLAGMSVMDNVLSGGYHRLVLGWFGSPQSLPDGSTLITLNFNFTGGISLLIWFDNGSSCEYADGSNNALNDVPQASYYINGAVCGSISNPGTILGDNVVCQGEQAVIYSVAPVTNATGYSWSVPTGATVISGGNTNTILVDFSATSASGLVSVYGYNPCGNGTVSEMPVTVNPLPLANAGNDIPIPHGTSALLSAQPGGAGSYSYHWSPEALVINPDNQNTQTVNLYSSTLFFLEVTDLVTLCGSNDDVAVTITTGPLSVNPESSQQTACSGEEVQLFSNAGGGSGNYIYSWTCNPPGNPPWSSNVANPAVFPEITTQYDVSVYDGYNYASGSLALNVHALPEATISGGDSICNDGSTANMSIELTGISPWTFTYSDGMNSYVIYGQTISPYTFSTSVPGIYSVLYVGDANCTGSTYGSAQVVVFPVPETPVISMNAGVLYSSSCCGNQWFLEGELIPGADSQVYEPVIPGLYSDMVTIDGCSSDTSNTIEVLHVNINTMGISVPRIYPNPSGDWFRISMPAGKELIEKIRILSITRTVVKEIKPNTNIFAGDPCFNISDLDCGLYIVAIECGSDPYFLMLIKSESVQ